MAKLFLSKSGILTEEDFINALREQFNNGDALYVQSDVMAFGKLAGPSLGRDDFFLSILSVFKNLVGANGHLIFPSFSFSWGSDHKEKVFDVAKSKSKAGSLSEFLRRKKIGLRTLDPMFSTIVIGPDADDWIKVGKDFFGPRSIFERLHERNALLMCFGTGRFSPTFIHYIEQNFDQNYQPLNYRRMKSFQGTLIASTGEAFPDNFQGYMRPLGSRIFCQEKNLVADLENQNKLFKAQIGNGTVQMARARDVFKTGLLGLKNNAQYFTKECATPADVKP